MTKDLTIKLNKQLKNLKEQLEETSDHIENERKTNTDDDSAVKQELLDKKTILEQQINQLKTALNNEELINESVYGKKYNLEINGSIRKIELVHPAEADPQHGKISIESPLAKALINKKTGDFVNVNTPVGSQNYKIV